MCYDEEKRIFTEAYERTIRNPEYAKHLEIISQLSRKITELLDSDAYLIEQCENAIRAAVAIRLYETYRTGNEDGYKFAKHILV